MGVRSWPGERPIGDEKYRGVMGPHRHHSSFDRWERFFLGWLRYDVDGMWREAEARAEATGHEEGALARPERSAAQRESSGRRPSMGPAAPQDIRAAVG
jgi:hypothetical protein